MAASQSLFIHLHQCRKRKIHTTNLPRPADQTVSVAGHDFWPSKRKVWLKNTCLVYKRKGNKASNKLLNFNHFSTLSGDLSETAGRLLSFQLPYLTSPEMTDVIATVSFCEVALFPPPTELRPLQPYQNLSFFFLKLITCRFLRQVEWVSATSLLQSKQKLHQVTSRRLQPGPPTVLGILLNGGGKVSCGWRVLWSRNWQMHLAEKNFFKSW